MERPGEKQNDPTLRITGKAGVLVICAVVALLGLGCLLVLRPFISAVLWAGILCFTTWPLFLGLERMLGGRRGLAASIATLALTLAIAAPFAVLGSTLASNLDDLSIATRKLFEAGPPTPPAWVAGVPLIGSRVSDYWLTLTQSSAARLEGLAKLLPKVKTVAVTGGAIVGSGIIQILLSLFITFFFYRDGDTVGTELSTVAYRIAGERAIALLQLAGLTVRAVVYGIIGTALVQGVLAAFGFLIAGVPGAVFLGFITCMVSMVPGGPLLVALPAAYWTSLHGSNAWAVFLVIWGTIVGAIDNIIKPLLIGRGVPTPMIIVMLGVLGGAMAFGLIGLFIGPTLLALGHTIYKEWTSVAAITAEPEQRVAQSQPEAVATL